MADSVRERKARVLAAHAASANQAAAPTRTRTRSPETNSDPRTVARPAKRNRRSMVDLASDDTELGATLRDLEKKFGKKTVTTGNGVYQPDRIPTGIFVLDLATLGGISNGRASMILGEKHAGKSTLLNKTMRGAQLMYPDQVCALVDPEGTFDKEWAAKNGVDLDRILISQPESGEQGGDVLEALVRTREVCYTGLDSIATLVPTAEIEGSMTDAHMGQQSRLINRIVRKSVAAMIEERKRGHASGLFLVNQWRTNIGQMFGDNRTVAGGRAVQHLASLEIHLKNKEVQGKDEGANTLTFNEHTMDIKKNKSNGGIRTGEFKLVRTNTLPDGTLYESASHDAMTMLAYSKVFNMYGGAGKNQYIELSDGTKILFNSQDALPSILYNDPDVYWQLRCELIATQAAKMRMPTKFIDAILAQPNVIAHDIENALHIMDSDYYLEE